jgi:hypothetical protein
MTNTDKGPEEQKYPIGGYAPGSYQQRCSCGTVYLGDKRSFQCEPCALRDEPTHKWIVEILDFISKEYSLAVPGEALYNQYNKDRFDRIIATLNKKL